MRLRLHCECFYMHLHLYYLHCWVGKRVGGSKFQASVTLIDMPACLIIRFFYFMSQKQIERRWHCQIIELCDAEHIGEPPSSYQSHTGVQYMLIAEKIAQTKKFVICGKRLFSTTTKKLNLALLVPTSNLIYIFVSCQIIVDISNHFLLLFSNKTL